MQSHKGKLKSRIQKQSNKEAKMANEQTKSNEYITQAVAEAARVAIQTMSMTGTAIAESVGPKVGKPMIKQSTFNWYMEDKYNELKNF